MVEAIQRYKNIFFLVGIILFALVLFNLFFQGVPQQETLVSDQRTEPAGTAGIAERELLATLLELKTITLNEQIFDDEVFRSLQDFSEELLPEPVGRRNPFAPLGSE